MEWAAAMEIREDNPCDRIGPALGAQNYVVQHMRALPHAEVASAIGEVRASNSKPVVKLAFEFLVVTAARGGEVRGAAWTEIDQDHGVWTIPAPRTKTNREHRVPLTGRALEILGEARAVGRGSPLVFPVRGNPLSNTALSRLLKRLGIGAVPHGFRSSFRDWAAEETDHPPRGGGGGACTRGPQPSRGRLPAHGPVRASASADGRLGSVPGRRDSRSVDWTEPLIRRARLRPSIVNPNEDGTSHGLPLLAFSEPAWRVPPSRRKTDHSQRTRYKATIAE